ncbi:MAG: Csp1 family four helix bundle copper storage protein [Mariprofundaceae bacterium]
MSKSKPNIDSTRRHLMREGASIMAGIAIGAEMLNSSPAFAAGTSAHGHHMRKNTKMSDAIHHCIQAGDDCIAHCLDLIKEGDTSIIDCLRSAEQMRNFCQAHAYLAAADSPFLNDACKLAIKICGDCSKQCDKHADKHAICKACRDACDACVKACKEHLKRHA